MRLRTSRPDHVHSGGSEKMEQQAYQRALANILFRLLPLAISLPQVLEENGLLLLQPMVNRRSAVLLPKEVRGLAISWRLDSFFPNEHVDHQLSPLPRYQVLLSLLSLPS